MVFDRIESFEFETGGKDFVLILSLQHYFSTNLSYLTLFFVALTALETFQTSIKLPLSELEVNKFCFI